MTSSSLPEVDYTVAFPDGPEGRWLVLSYQSSEELSGDCNAVLDLATDDAAPDLSAFLGSTCELMMARADGPARYFYGVVLRVDLLGRVEHRLVLRVHVVSAFELGRQRRHSRIWQGVSTLDVVSEVLDELLSSYGRTYDATALSRGSEPRTYCVQFRETDFDFVKRLLEEEGISYCFVHHPDAGHEVLTLCDDNEQYESIENLDGSSAFPLIAVNPDQAEFESIQGLEWSQQLTSTAVLRRDYDWQYPRELLTVELDGADQRDRVRRIHSHLSRRFERDDVERRAQDLAHALALRGSVASGRSNIVGLRPGARFTTDVHSIDGAPDEYIVTHVRHRGGDPKAASFGIGEGAVYSNEFECVPAKRPIRPLPITPRPDVRGAQTATVVGEGEIYTDEHARIQVQFHWEEAPSFAAGASCWVRCAQSWAGPGWGAQFIPRVGMEVVVEFLEGNPDRPLVVGCVYNGSNEPPFAVPGRATQSGWRTSSSPGGGGSNELRFEDAAGSEEIFIHGQKDWRVKINNNTTKSTGNDETLSVGHDRTKTVGNDESEAIGANKTIEVGANHTETIGASMSLMVGQHQAVTVGSNQAVAIGADRTETIGASASQVVAATKSTTVGGVMNTIVGGAMNVSVGATSTEEVGGVKSVTVGGLSTENVVGNRSVSAASIQQTARKKISLDAGAELSATAKKDLALASEGTMGAQAKKKFTIEVGDEFVIKCGSSTLSMKKNGQIVLKGKKITVHGSDKVTIKGSKVHEN